MNISKLQEPYKTLAKLFKREKTDVLSQAFNWMDCTGKTVKSHARFWSAVNDGKKPKIPKGIITYYEKHSGKKLPVVMGMPKKLTEKQKAEVKENVRKAVLKKAAAKVSAKAVGPTPEQLEAFKLIGRKMTAFPFEPDINDVGYHKSMDNVIGHDGTIIEVSNGAVLLSFRRTNGDIQFWYPFGKEVKSFATGRSAEEYLIPEEEVQKILDAMPENPFIVGQTVYFRGNGGQYKCTVTRADFSGPAPITIDPGKPLSVWSTTVDGRSLPEKYPSLSHIPWCDVNGVQLEMLNAEPEEPIRTKDQIIAALEKDLDDAYKNEEVMLKELNLNLDRAVFHCVKVEETSGSITLDDVTYCLHLIKRVMHHQFGYKPKQEEV